MDDGVGVGGGFGLFGFLPARQRTTLKYPSQPKQITSHHIRILGQERELQAAAEALAHTNAKGGWVGFPYGYIYIIYKIYMSV
jgi:hypothetical protein